MLVCLEIWKNNQYLQRKTYLYWNCCSGPSKELVPQIKPQPKSCQYPLINCLTFLASERAESATSTPGSQRSAEYIEEKQNGIIALIRSMEQIYGNLNWFCKRQRPQVTLLTNYNIKIKFLWNYFVKYMTCTYSWLPKKRLCTLIYFRLFHSCKYVRI